MRPAHIHFVITADGYKKLTTQLFTRNDQYIWADAVFGEKESLLVDFTRNNDPNVMFEWGSILISGCSRCPRYPARQRKHDRDG